MEIVTVDLYHVLLHVLGRLQTRQEKRGVPFTGIHLFFECCLAFCKKVTVVCQGEYLNVYRTLSK